MHTTAEHTTAEILAACKLAHGRFHGRAALTRRAALGVPVPARLKEEQRLRREWARLHALVEDAVASARLRTARHAHTTCVEVLPPDAAAAVVSQSRTDCYRKPYYRVTVSRHTWRLPEGCTPVARGGCVYLSQDARVRNGRGTALVVERRAVGRDGKEVWRAD